MKRRIVLALVVLAALAGGAWFFGRAPSDYVLHEECRRYYVERRATDDRLRRELARASLGRPGLAPRALQARMQLMSYLREHRRLEIRGWEVVLIPAGAARPDPEDYYRAGSFDPSTAADHRDVQGEMEIWIAPRGALARLLDALGLEP